MAKRPTFHRLTATAKTDERVALQAEASHGATYLAMLVERAIALSRLMGRPESAFQIHLHEFCDVKPPEQVDRTSFWSCLHQDGLVVLPSGLEIKYFRETRVRIRHRVYGRLSKLLVRLKGLSVRLSAHRSILETCEVLRLKFAGVVIGDLVLSTALRSDPGSIAHPHKTRRLSRLLAEGAARVTFAAKHQGDLKDAAVTAIWCTPEASYLQAILPRAATQKHFGLELVDDAEGTISLIYAKNLAPIPPLLIVPTEGVTDRVWASKHLQGRLNILDERTEKRTAENVSFEHARIIHGKIDVVVFLHDFADGEFMNGFDGLGSNYQWAEFTLTNLVKTSGLRISVKPHPAIRADSKIGRKVFGLITSLQENSSKSINWLAPNCFPQTRLRSGTSVGITRYGTVAEELTYRGIPVVASKNAPYAAHNFATHWEDLESYSEVLHALPRIAANGVSAYQKESCLDYVYRRHSHWGPPFWERAAHALAAVRNPTETPDSWYQLEDLLQVASTQEFYELVQQTSRTCPVIVRRQPTDLVTDSTGTTSAIPLQ